jgi:hypothetical protein
VEERGAAVVAVVLPLGWNQRGRMSGEMGVKCQHEILVYSRDEVLEYGDRSGRHAMMLDVFRDSQYNTH